MKKTFAQTKVGKFLLNKIPGIVGSLAGNTTVSSIISAIIGGSEMSEGDKNIALKKLDLERAEMDNVSQRWTADAKSGFFLAANVRPIVLLLFSISYLIGFFLGYSLESISGVVSIIIGSYFGSRGVEKVFGDKHHK